MAAAVPGDPQRFDSDPVASEFLATSLSADARPQTYYDERLPENPHIRQLRSDQRGYTLLDFDRRQVAATLRNFDVPHGVIAAGWYGDHRLPVQVASVFTLTRRLERYAAPDLVIVDEAHHATAGTTWGRLLAEWPASYVIGVSATPVRLSGEGLGECFDEMVEGPTTADLIAAGRLSRYRLFAPQLIATADLHTRAGEYRTDELEAVSDRPSVTGDAIGHYEKQGGRGRAVAFCVSVAHAHHVAESFRAAGHEAVAVDGGMELRRHPQLDIDKIK